MWKAGRVLMDRKSCEKIGREQQRQLSTAFEVIGKRHLPPGMNRPNSVKDPKKGLEAML
jgi:hypothetical protein